MYDESGSSADSGHYAGVERRRCKQAGQSAGDVLRQIPATVVLERLPIPVLAVGPAGGILFANTAFCAMLGYCNDAVRKLRFEKIFQSWRADGRPALDLMRAHADELVTLAHSQGYAVRARMSKSALLRRDDKMVLATFCEFTDQLWRDDEQQSGSVALSP